MQLTSAGYDDAATELVAKLLRANGYCPEPYAGGPEGEANPDIYVSAPDKLWIEVKVVGPEPYERAYDLASEYAKARFSRRPPAYSVGLYVHQAATHGDYRFLFDLIDEAACDDTDTVFVALGANYDKSNIQRYWLETELGRHWIVAATSDSLPLSPWQLGTPIWDVPLQIKTDHGFERRMLRNWNDQNSCGST